MLEWLKKHKVKIISALFVIVFMTIIFFLTGNSYGSGRKNGSPETATAGDAEYEYAEAINAYSEYDFYVSEEETEKDIQDSSSFEEDIQKDNDTKADIQSVTESTTQASAQTYNQSESQDAAQSEKPASTQSAVPENTHESAQSNSNDNTMVSTDVTTENTEEKSEKHTCTISICCATIINNTDKLDPAKEGLVPSNGVILSSREVTFEEGETVYDVLKRVCRENGIHMEQSGGYIEGINNIYEFDCGELSGWMYSVNGWFPNYGCNSYTLNDNDVIKWVYTCDLGYDVGGGN